MYKYIYIYIYIYICVCMCVCVCVCVCVYYIHMYIYVHIHLYMTRPVKTKARPVITTMSLWQLMVLGSVHHVPKYMSCHKDIVVIAGLAFVLTGLVIYKCICTYIYICK